MSEHEKNGIDEFQDPLSNYGSSPSCENTSEATEPHSGHDSLAS